MKDFGDPVPVGMVSIADALDLVYRLLTPNWQTLEERVNPSSSHYDAFPNPETRELAHREACRSYDEARARAHEWLREELSQGTLVAWVRDPKTGSVEQLDHHKWTANSLETVSAAFDTGAGVVMGERRSIFLDRQSLHHVTKGIASVEGHRAAQPSGTALRTSRAKATQQQQILDLCRALWPAGCNERPAQRNEMIRSEFRRLRRTPPTDRSIQRALKSD